MVVLLCFIFYQLFNCSYLNPWGTAFSLQFSSLPGWGSENALAWYLIISWRKKTTEPYAIGHLLFCPDFPKSFPQAHLWTFLNSWFYFPAPQFLFSSFHRFFLSNLHQKITLRPLNPGCICAVSVSFLDLQLKSRSYRHTCWLGLITCKPQWGWSHHIDSAGSFLSPS